MIELRDVSKAFQIADRTVHALDHVSFSVARDEIVCVIGRSGAGKSTLLRCVNVLERPTEGEVWVNDQNLLALPAAELRAARRTMGMIFQHFNLLNTRTVFENVAFPLRLIHLAPAEIEARVRPLLALTGLAGHAMSYPAQLSGGQKQRVAIARALATNPTVLLCDEMTSALDPETTQSILALLRDIRQARQLAILMITHEMEVVKRVADRVIVLDAGRVVEAGSVLDIFKHPHSTMGRALTESALHVELPAVLQAALQSVPDENQVGIWRVVFVGETAGQPLVTHLVRDYGLSVNILQARLEWLQCEAMGVMVMSVEGAEAQMHAAVHELTAKGLSGEVMGYVARDHWRG